VTNLLELALKLPNSRHVLGLLLLCLDQLRLDPGCCLPKVLTRGFLPLPIRLTLFNRGDEVLDLTGERFDTFAGLELRLLETQQILLSMFTRRSDPLSDQLGLCHLLLQHLYAIVDLTKSCPHLVESGFLSELFTHPLRKLGFTGPHLLLELLDLSRTLSCDVRQRLDSLRQISEDLSDPSHIFLERQCPHLGVA
jgi:hypothetical protein